MPIHNAYSHCQFKYVCACVKFDTKKIPSSNNRNLNAASARLNMFQIFSCSSVEVSGLNLFSLHLTFHKRYMSETSLSFMQLILTFFFCNHQSTGFQILRQFADPFSGLLYSLTFCVSSHNSRPEQGAVIQILLFSKVNFWLLFHPNVCHQLLCKYFNKLQQAKQNGPL